MLRFLPIVAICAVSLLFFLYNYHFSVEFPFQDDFLFIQFIDAVSADNAGFTDVVREMFRTFNDHKAVVPRFISLLDYELTGRLHLRFYIVLVSINLIYIFYFLYLNFRKANLPLYYFIPVPFLFFHPLYHDVSGWALTGMQHSYLTAFTVTAITLVSRGTKPAFYLAMVCCFLATFTHGNGILSFPAIIFFFLCQKNFRSAVLTGVFMIICLVIYLAGYESGQAVNLPKSAGLFFSSLFGFVGSAMSLWGDAELWSALWGLVIVVGMLLVTIRVAAVYWNKPVRVKPGTIELLTLFAFIFISSTVIAVFRSWAGTTIASRFQLYASLSTCIFYIFLLFYTDFFKKKWVFTCALALSVFYWAYSHYRFTGIVASKKTTYLADIYNWRNNRSMFSVERSIVEYGAFYLVPGYQKGYFWLPEAVVEKKELEAMFAEGKPTVDKGIYVETWDIHRVVRDGVDDLTYYFVSSNVSPPRKRLLDDRFLVMKNANTGLIYLINANPKVEARKNIITEGHYYKPGFNTLLRENDLDAGNYQLAILDVSGSGDKSFYPLGRMLVATGDAYMLK
ncbi:hypothetical protein [Dyadobacter fermentans]|uniref:Uncharacterized protein n=1 Tax=Dyadobacter fermentans (strain ATCC 700827 / DSM 18053 / CIP 107007 / KCTC 52180 / NS114) TaxID=471854 RepID=C6W6X4_DYAFD|nr:hypothetical protein [Dyadobacter fermentans]ACT96185.1 hypothetical protein Dfer_4985 [Dyadobacter fermentans DSM 18053]